MSKYKIRPNNLAIGHENDEITALALGSGIAVCLYDSEERAGGMAYTLFPDSKACNELQISDKLRYVDTALEILLDEVVKEGAEKDRLWAKILGGAQIFHFGGGISRDNVGRQNVAAAREWLKKQHIYIKSEDTGNNFGRTVRFFLEDGNVEVELVNKHKYYI